MSELENIDFCILQHVMQQDSILRQMLPDYQPEEAVQREVLSTPVGQRMVMAAYDCDLISNETMRRLMGVEAAPPISGLDVLDRLVEIPRSLPPTPHPWPAADDPTGIGLMRQLGVAATEMNDFVRSQLREQGFSRIAMAPTPVANERIRGISADTVTVDEAAHVRNLMGMEWIITRHSFNADGSESIEAVFPNGLVAEEPCELLGPVLPERTRCLS